MTFHEKAEMFLIYFFPDFQRQKLICFQIDQIPDELSSSLEVLLNGYYWQQVGRISDLNAREQNTQRYTVLMLFSFFVDICV